MKGINLYRFLRSLDQSERNQSTRFLNRPGYKGKKYSHLYRMLLESSSFNQEKVLKALYNDLEKDAALNRLESTCDYLAKQILMALASKDSEINSEIAFIIKAKEKGFYKIAEKSLIRALKIASDREEFEELHLLFKEKAELEQVKSAPIAFEGFSRIEMFQILTNLEQIYQSLELIKAKKWLFASGKKTKEIQEIEQMIQDIRPQSQREKFGLLLINTRIETFQGNIREACFYQGRALKIIRDNSIPQLSTQLVRESGAYLRLLQVTGQFEEANKENLRLQGTKLLTSHDQGLKIYYCIAASLISALSMGRISVGLCAVQELENSVGNIPPAKRANLFYYAALLMYWTREWRELRKWINHIQDLPPKYRKPLSWQPLLLLSLSYMEEEESDLANLYLNRLVRKAKDSPRRYPHLVAKALRNIAGVPISESKLMLRQLNNDIMELFSDEEERFAANYFDLSLWIEARLSGQSLFEVLENQKFVPIQRMFKVV